jgi:N-acetylneuraminic acid mutarotase
MAAPRSDHTATLLPDGKVLVAGGVTGDYLSGTERVATAEVYDPASGTWSATGSMAKPRVGHTATLLPDGKVLVVGGGDGSSVLATAEVYDPASGTWSATGSMGTPRGAHHAALLLNGQVLVVGGRNDTASMLETAEVYDPASGTWSATGSMITPRRTHTVTPLPNGQVLVAGGKEGFPISLPMLETAEVYDPASGTWSATGSMTTPRAGHTATLLPDGKVLVAGGTPKATSEVYDPVSGHWSTVSAMTEPRFFHTAVPLPDSKVLVFKGRPTYDPSPRERIPAAVYTVEVYTP